MQCQIFDPHECALFLGDVACRATDAANFPQMGGGDAGVNADPTVFVMLRAQVGDVVPDFTMAFEQGEETAVADVGGIDFKVKKAAPQKIVGSHPENMIGRAV